MINLNESNFQQEISEGLVLVDFYATWCGPCRVLAPIVGRLENIKLTKIDGSTFPELVVENKVTAYPTLIFFKNGQEVKRIVGLTSQEKLQDIVNELNMT